MVVYTCVLMMQSAVEYPARKRVGREHAGDKRLKLDVAVIKFIGYGTRQLHFDGLKAAENFSICCNK